MTTRSWRDRAACRGVDPEVFFPFDADHAGVKLAKSVCARCPVRDECLAEAMTAGLDDGVWGGMTPGERRALRRTDVLARLRAGAA